MKDSKRFALYIILPLLLPGLLVAAWRCFFRNIAEKKNVYVETVVDFEELRQLARDEGWKLDEMLSKAKKSGASSVAVTEDTLASLESEGRITILSYQEIQKLSLEDSFKAKVPTGQSTLGALWIHSVDDKLLDRIEQTLSWKIPSEKIYRVHRNFLLLNKSGDGVKTRIGLGFSPKYLSLVRKNNLGIVLRIFNYPNLLALDASRIINSLPAPASVSALLFAEKEVFGNRGQLKKIIDLFRDRAYRIGWIEFNIQDGIKTYLNQLSSTRPFVRVHSISRKEIDQIYNVNRAVARWVRAVRDRSIKMLYIRCFFQDDKKFIRDLVEFNLNYISKIAKKLTSYGFKIASNREQRFYEPKHMVGKMSRAEQLAIGLALFLGFPFLFVISYKPENSSNYYIFMAVFTLIAFFALSPDLFVALAGITGAFSYASIGVVWAIDSLKKENKNLITYLTFVFKLIIPSILGGILIAGIYAETEYLLKFKQFRGIKLSFILPLLWIFVWSIRNYGKGFLSFFSKPLTPISAVIMIAVLGGLTIYILRSGNVTFLKPSAYEDSMRTFLENSLFARPRNKEFLVGYPAAFLFIFLYFKRAFAILPIMAIFIQVGQVSVVNTFCHFHSPLYMTFIRTFNGLWLGIVIGVLMLLIFMFARLVYYLGANKKDSIVAVGYFGFGNFGDELLLRKFSKFVSKNFSDKQLIALYKGDNYEQLPKEIQILKRKNLYEVVEEIIKTKVLVIPGGGVLQSITSERSLVYYTFLLLLARLSGAKIILPAQGIGPWKEPMNKVLKKILVYILKNADYLSVRDQTSKDELTKLDSNIFESIKLTSDLSFYDVNIEADKVAEAPENLKILVVLRSSIDGSENVASELIDIANELETIKLIPIALQPEEDVKVWHKVGWEGQIPIIQNENDRLFKQADLIVTMRLHGCVLATQKSIPWIGIEYDPKVKSFAEQVKWSYSASVEKIDKKSLEKQLEQIGTRWVKLKQNLARSSQKLTRKSQDDFASLVKILTDLTHSVPRI